MSTDYTLQRSISDIQSSIARSIRARAVGRPVRPGDYSARGGTIGARVRRRGAGASDGNQGRHVAGLTTVATWASELRRRPGCRD